MMIFMTILPLFYVIFKLFLLKTLTLNIQKGEIKQLGWKVESLIKGSGSKKSSKFKKGLNKKLDFLV